MKKMGLMAIIILSAFFLFACGTQEKDTGTKFLMESSTADWPKEMETACHLAQLGKPLGTVKEETTYKKNVWEVTFSIDEEMTQELVDAYAQTVWDASIKANDARPHSCNGYIYQHVKEASRLQEPLNYYIWYYFAKQREYRVGIYPTMMEEGRPGGLILRIERWF